jgi:hypothetical protein
MATKDNTTMKTYSKAVPLSGTDIVNMASMFPEHFTITVENKNRRTVDFIIASDRVWSGTPFFVRVHQDTGACDYLLQLASFPLA